MIIQTLPKWFWVNNPINLVFEQETTETLDYATVKIYDGLTLLAETVYIAPADPGIPVLMTADISGLAKELVTLASRGFSAAYVDYAYGHYRNCTIKVYINAVQTLIYDADHVFVYGGIEATDDIDIDDYLQAAGADVPMEWLTEFDEPTIFEGQPFELCFSRRGYTPSTGFDLTILWTYWRDHGFTWISDYELTTIAVQGVTTFDIIKVNKPYWTLPLPDGTKYVTISEAPHPDHFLSEITCKYVIPFTTDGIMLRWLNRLGGIDTYYFIKKDTVSRTKTTAVAVPANLDFTNNWNKGHAKVVTKDKSKSFVIGAFMLTTNEFDVISNIADSELVEMYLGSGKWMQVLVNDAGWNLPNDNDYHDIEFSITTI